MATWRPDLHTLRLFVAVCEEASIARAADRESIVPSAISKRIAEMESLVGVQLLVRGARGVRPTAAGHTLLHHAQQIVRTSEQLQNELAEYAGGVRGHIRLFANVSSIVEFLPKDLSHFLTANPQLRVDLQERVSPQVVEGVREGVADLGVCLGTADTSGLDVMPYGADRLSVVVHPSHRLADTTEIAFDEVLNESFVALNPDSGTTRLLTGLAARRGRVLHHRIYVSTFEAACHVVAENLAIAILAEDAVKVLTQALGLRTVHLTDDWARRDMVICMRNRDTLAPAPLALLEHLLNRQALRLQNP